MGVNQGDHRLNNSLKQPISGGEQAVKTAENEQKKKKRKEGKEEEKEESE